MMGQNDVITLKTKLCRPNHLHPEDSRRLEIVQNSTEDNVIEAAALQENNLIKTAPFEEDEIEFNTKENAVDYAYVTITTVYMPGQTRCLVQEDAAKLGGGEQAQIRKYAVARREERLCGN